ncbi:LPXTG-site transpeptidase (sortase) family protein [Leifsonia sp. AK011]|uniref:sortase domain-containing protein n=1 Tax=Leifsonia sp. AK011 TaxID=2723075 RepID=UPI0015C8398A|nr:sortase [Leifsonia sp. AK011]NYF09056.1 LPXTG-site transpeptidase (sortase) family protein [Leifsonia sp. AK011]
MTVTDLPKTAEGAGADDAAVDTGSLRELELAASAPSYPPPNPMQRMPQWMQRPPSPPKQPRVRPNPRQIRWWIGVAWTLIAALSLGFVAHVTLVGWLQHSRGQFLLYEELRVELAKATAPLGQLDVDGNLVPNGTPIGTLTIDSIGVNEVFVQGTRPDDLLAAPGHMRDTVMPGQEGRSVIMGRQATYGGPFQNLSALEDGDVIEVTTAQGTSTYEVFNIRREGDLLSEPLEPGEGMLELVTADGAPLAPSGVLHVDAALVSEVHETPSPVFTEKVLDASELPMGSAPTDWLPVLFWFQWLAIATIALRWVRGRWGVWQTWVVTVPVLLALGAATANAAMSMLPNLL